MFEVSKETSDRVNGIVAEREAIVAGKFRNETNVSGGGNVRLATGGVAEGTPQHELPERWADLCEYLDGVHDVRLRVLIRNASMTRTQYYFDGNKRTARILMAGELMTEGFDAIGIPNARRLEFNTSLDEMFTTNDATSLMAFVASCAPGAR